MPPVAIRMEKSLLSTLVAPRYIIGIHINHEDANVFQRPEDHLDLTPTLPELLRLLGVPLRHDFFRKRRRLIEEGACEIEKEWALHDRHLNEPQIVRKTEELSHME